MIDMSTLAAWAIGVFTTLKLVHPVKQMLWVFAKTVRKRSSFPYSAPRIASIIIWYVFLTLNGMKQLTYERRSTERIITACVGSVAARILWTSSSLLKIWKLFPRWMFLTILRVLF